MNPAQATPAYVYHHDTHFNLSTHLHIGLPSGVFPSGFSIRAIRPANLIFLLIFGEVYKSRSS
jgi:hypothetical protein